MPGRPSGQALFAESVARSADNPGWRNVPCHAGSTYAGTLRAFSFCLCWRPWRALPRPRTEAMCRPGFFTSRPAATLTAKNARPCSTRERRRCKPGSAPAKSAARKIPPQNCLFGFRPRQATPARSLRGRHPRFLSSQSPWSCEIPRLGNVRSLTPASKGRGPGRQASLQHPGPDAGRSSP